MTYTRSGMMYSAGRRIKLKPVKKAANPYKRSRSTGAYKKTSVYKPYTKPFTKAKLFQRAKQNIPGMAGAGTFTTHTVKHALTKWQKELKKNTQTQTYAYNQASTLSCTTGTQGSNFIATIYDNAALTAQYNTNAPSDGDGTGKFILENAQAISYFTNQGNNPIAMDIYDIVCRKDMPQRSEAGLNDPVTLWTAGLLRIGGSATTKNTPGCTPFQSTDFCQNWKVLKVSKVQLPQGGTHEHRQHIQLNKNFNATLLFNGDYYYHGMSHYSFAVVRGFPIDSQENPGNVSLAPAKIDVVTTYRYEWMNVSQQNNATSIINNLPLITDPQMINIGSGQVSITTVA